MKNNNQNTTNNATKELLKDNPKVLQFLHDFRGFDFCKPFEVVKNYGTFTVNSIKKAIGKSSFYGLNITILLKREGERTNNLYIAYITENEKLRGYANKDVLYFDAYERKIETTDSVEDFEHIRKKETEYIYIIYQTEKYRMTALPKPYKVYKIDTARRYKLIKARSTYYGAKAVIGISSIEIKDTTTNSGPLLYDFPVMTKHVPKTTKEIIDKSGYIIIDRRNDLRQRAAARRAEKEKAEYLRRDFSEENKRTREELIKTARKAAEMLNIAEEEADFTRIKNCVDALRWAAFYLQIHEEKTAKKEFASIDAFRGSIESIKDDIARALNALEPEKKDNCVIAV